MFWLDEDLGLAQGSAARQTERGGWQVGRFFHVNSLVCMHAQSGHGAGGCSVPEYLSYLPKPPFQPNDRMIIQRESAKRSQDAGHRSARSFFDRRLLAQLS